MTQGDPREQQDSASEGFHSAGSADGDQATTNPPPTVAAPGGQPDVTVPATTVAPAVSVPAGTATLAAAPATNVASAPAAPSAATTNPARPTLPDVTTPEGLAAARDLLRRALDITSRHASQSSGQSWAATRPSPAAPVTATIVPPHAAPAAAPVTTTQATGGGFIPLSGGAPTVPVPTTSVGPGAPSVGTGISSAASSYGVAAPPALPSAPAWTGAPATAGAVPPMQPPVPAWNAIQPASGVAPPTPSNAAAWTYTPLTANAAPTPTPSTTSGPTPTSIPTPRLRSAIAAYDGVSLEGAPAAAGYGYGVTPAGVRFVNGQGVAPPQPTWATATTSVPAVSPPVPQPVYGAQGIAGPVASTSYGGMPSYIKNAVRMIQPFHSDHATVGKAKLFWDSFARATTGLEEQLRISAFRECLKGKPAEEWWMYSKIYSFETLRVRFHNQFICLSPLQLIERLKTTKRSRGMSAEVWGDLVQSLCDEAQCFDPTMRYQYFLSGLWNREWKAALSSAMASTIQHAVLILLQRGMHIPVEDDADFADEKPSEKKPEDSNVKEMMEMLRQNQNLIMQQQADLARAPRSPRRPQYAAAAYENQSVAQPSMQNAQPTLPTVPYTPVKGIRQGPDMYTQDGRTVCGRCHMLGCSRINCRRQRFTCGNCKQQGHATAECEAPSRNQGNNGGGQGQPRRQGGGGSLRPCFGCGKTDHYAANCPAIKTFQQMAVQAQAAASAQGTPPAQQ